MHTDVVNSVDGLKARVVEGVLCFDRPVPVRNMATATVRGLAGHLLRAYRPDVADRWFKPGLDGDCPAAYVFQPVLEHATETAEWPFRVIAWDPPDVFIPALQEVMIQARGCPFGEGDVRVLSTEWTATHHLAFEGIHEPAPVQRLVMRTPLRLRRGDRWVTETTLSLADVTRAVGGRLNRLSREYGNGLQLELPPLVEQAADTVEVKRSLRLVQSGRRSSTQNRDVDLSGLVGHLSCRGLGAGLASLLSVGALIHAGKHTAEGCGVLRIEDE